MCVDEKWEMMIYTRLLWPLISGSAYLCLIVGSVPAGLDILWSLYLNNKVDKVKYKYIVFAP